MNFTLVSRVVMMVGFRNSEELIIPLGTACLLPKEGRFVTSAHLVRDHQENLVIVLNTIESIGGYQDTTNNEVSSVDAIIEQIDPIHDLCILKTPAYTARSNIVLSGTDAANIGDDIVIFGYPHCDHGRFVLTQFDTSIGAKILLGLNGIKAKNIVLNILSRPGQSGGPVFKASDGQLIAVLTGAYIPKGSGGVIICGIDPNSLHQTTHAVSAEYIKEMLE